MYFIFQSEQWTYRILTMLDVLVKGLLTYLVRKSSWLTYNS